jgi:hypothetical protein
MIPHQLNPLGLDPEAFQFDFKPYQYYDNSIPPEGDYVNNYKLTLPLRISGSTYQYDFYVDWGDGSAVTHYTYSGGTYTRCEHTYSVFNMTYPVSIRGRVDGWSYFGYSSNDYDQNMPLGIIRVKNWGNISFKYFVGGFESAYNLVSIANPNYNTFTQCTDLSSMFAGCTNLTSIPAGLLKGCSSVTKLDYAFQGCSSLTSIPSGLFDDMTALTSCNSLFRACYNITSIPVDLFRYNTLITDFAYCFQLVSQLTSIPADIFKYNTLATTFTYCFYGCVRVASIPTDIFRYNTLATTFYSTFAYMTLYITSLPADLFRYNTAATTFTSCFSGCTALTTIPSNLFYYNTAATDFSNCFSSSGVTAVPAGLFTQNTAALTFQSCFNSCNSLTSIGSALLATNINARDLSYMFYICNNIASIPSDLFPANNAWSAGGTIHFDGMFYRQTAGGPTGTVQDIWNITGHGLSYSICFRNDTNLSNYASIPAGWK